ncbi:oxidoreductase [Pedobacter sp. Leaf216]|uniref:FAD-dependent oxidoreductase n=1 Tax=Pedobacter sp. Leaf216 TaxID=1735684 RepID=UPI0006FE528D|nr:FAD-dependent oxidoreductase [Pedobacter sp. Leaf216]KQM78480.1 oxidoreductase [Pedobacter sp. Leaf216]
MKNNKKNGRDGKNISLWQANEKIENYQQENSTNIYDALIIGGGITGLTTAYNLQREGKKCLLVDAHNLGYGTTGGTTAHLNTFFDATYPEIDSDFGKDASKLIAAAGKKMIASIKNNIDELHIDADFEYKDGYLFSQNDEETEQLQQILSSSQEAGVAVTESEKNGVPIEFQYSICFKEQAQFHPLKYIYGLAKGFKQLGGEILEGIKIKETTFKEGIHTAAFKGGEIKAKNLVWATHIPPGINILSLRNAPYRSYVLAVTLSDDAYPECISYDMKEPYHYFRSHEIDGQKYLIIGGADHKTGHDDPEKAFEDLENYARQYFKIAEINFRWSSQYYVPVDGLPYIGQMPGGDDRTYLATGFNGNGMIFGSLSGALITDLILGKENELTKLLSPSRLKPISGFSEFVKENADVAYHFVADRFGNQVLDSLNNLANGEGKIASFDGEKLAIYKSEEGKITALDPVCTHAGCIVNWNASEKSWDCPCHGGRFDTDGCVLTGPPREPLKKVEVSGNKIVDEAK